MKPVVFPVLAEVPVGTVQRYMPGHENVLRSCHAAVSGIGVSEECLGYTPPTACVERGWTNDLHRMGEMLR